MPDVFFHAKALKNLPWDESLLGRRVQFRKRRGVDGRDKARDIWSIDGARRPSHVAGSDRGQADTKESSQVECPHNGNTTPRLPKSPTLEHYRDAKAAFAELELVKQPRKPRSSLR
jgi:hypothetical protein